MLTVGSRRPMCSYVSGIREIIKFREGKAQVLLNGDNKEDLDSAKGVVKSEYVVMRSEKLRPKKAGRVRSSLKVLLTCFFFSF